MPGGSDALSSRENTDALTDSDDVANRLMPRHAREHISKMALLQETVGVTDAARENLDQDLAWTGLLELDFSDSQFGTLVLEERGLVSRGKGHSRGERNA